MTDYVTLPGTGSKVATEELATKQVQRVKTVLGHYGVDDGDLMGDAFGRLRVSAPQLLIDEKSVTASPLIGNAASGGASYSKPANKSSFYLTTGGVGSIATRQTRVRAVYQPGKSQFIQQTFTFGTATTGIVQRVGYFDDSNGLFLELDGSSLSFVIRSKYTGSVVDTKIGRALWFDKLDGTGPSGKTLDLTKSQILEMDFQWLVVGRVRFGFVIDGAFILAAVSNWSNRQSGVYMTNPNQPLRWQIESTSSAAAVTLEAICGCVSTEGANELRGISLGYDTDGTPLALGAAAYGELIAIRLTSAGALVGTSSPINISVLCASTANFLWELWLQAAGMSGGTWSTPNGSLIEQNTTRTGSYTAGTGLKIASGFVSQSANAGVSDIFTTTGLGYDINTGLADVLSLRIYNIAGNNSFYGGITMRQEA